MCLTGPDLDLAAFHASPVCGTPALALAGPGSRGGGALTLILAGIALPSFAGAPVSLAPELSPNISAPLGIVSGLPGSLPDRTTTQVWLALSVALAGWTRLAPVGRGLDAPTLVDDTAAAPGVPPPRRPLPVDRGTDCAVGALVAAPVGAPVGAPFFLRLLASLRRPLA